MREIVAENSSHEGTVDIWLKVIHSVYNLLLLKYI